jgi:protein-L-isoaspartate(D-aspartate) O-methyltransferase
MNEPTITQMKEDLIQAMRKNGSLRSASVEEAFRAVPRHYFLPDEPLERVYSDVAIAVKKTDDNRWTSSSSQPSMMAIMLEQLDLQPGQKVLEIGAGSGYNAALMAKMVGPEGHVVTMDIQPDLVERARAHMDSTGFTQVATVTGDGASGFPENAPYDRIILTVSSWVIVPAWRDQLAEGGRLVLPLDLDRIQKSVAFERRGDELVSLSVFSCGFMSLQGAFAAPPPFQLPLDADEHVMLTSQEKLPVGTETFNDWLTASPNDLATGVEVRSYEVESDLLLWLNLHARNQWANLTAAGEDAIERSLPVVMALDGDWKHTETMVYIEPRGAAALTRPAGQKISWMNWNLPEKEQPPDLPFEINVRSLGPDDQLARRITAYIREWAARGKPSSGRLHLRAIPAEKDIQPQENEFLIEKPYTRLVLWYA